MSVGTDLSRPFGSVNGGEDAINRSLQMCGDYLLCVMYDYYIIQHLHS